MFGTAWMDKEPGQGVAGVFVAQDEGPGPIKDVVSGIRNQPHLSPIEIKDFVNTAVQNESGTLKSEMIWGEELSADWQRLADGFDRKDSNSHPSKTSPEKAEYEAKTALEQAKTKYDNERALLAEMVVDLREDGEISLSSETWEALANIDEDGYFSEALGFNVQDALVQAQASEQSRSRHERGDFDGDTVVNRRGFARADFSREITEAETMLDSQGRDLSGVPAQEIEAASVMDRLARGDEQADLVAAEEAAQARRTDRKLSTGRQSGAPVKVGAVFNDPGFTDAWTQASRDKLRTAREDEAAKASAKNETQADTGPELG